MLGCQDACVTAATMTSTSSRTSSPQEWEPLKFTFRKPALNDDGLSST
jgi:hypothetical protein